MALGQSVRGGLRGCHGYLLLETVVIKVEYALFAYPKRPTVQRLADYADNA